MSRIGKAPIHVPHDVALTLTDQRVVVKGPKGEIVRVVPKGISVVMKNSDIHVNAKSQDKRTKALHGLVRARLASDVTGVTTGWTKTLELSGVGYRASLSGTNLVLAIGFSHPVTIEPPAGITFSLVEGKIVVSGISKDLVGQITANIRAIKKPEPYKGKGILYAGEIVRKKAGKAKAIGGAPGSPGK